MAVERVSVGIEWRPSDVATLRPGWSAERCARELSAVAGRLRARLCAEGWTILDDLLPPHGDPRRSPDALLATIKRVLVDHLACRGPDDGDTLADLGADSLDLVDLACGLEDAVPGLMLSDADDEVLSDPGLTVAEIAAYLWQTIQKG